jgi:hypothetical protein
MDFLADMRTNDGAADTGRTVAGGNVRQLKIKAAQIVVPWRALMIRDKVIGYAHVPEDTHERRARRFAEIDRTDDEAVRIGEPLIARYFMPANSPCCLRGAAGRE